MDYRLDAKQEIARGFATPREDDRIDPVFASKWVVAHCVVLKAINYFYAGAAHTELDSEEGLFVCLSTSDGANIAASEVLLNRLENTAFAYVILNGSKESPLEADAIRDNLSMIEAQYAQAAENIAPYREIEFLQEGLAESFLRLESRLQRLSTYTDATALKSLAEDILQGEVRVREKQSARLRPDIF